MDAEQGFAPNIALTFASCVTSSFISDDKQNEPSFTSNSWPLVAGPFEHEPNLAFHSGWLPSHFPYSSTRSSYFYPYQDGNALGQDTIQASSLLDTRGWSPSLCYVTPCVTSGTLFPSEITGSLALPASLDVVSNGLTGSFIPDVTLSHGIASEPQVILHSQARPDLSPSYPNPTTYHYTYPNTDLNQPSFPTHCVPTTSTEVANFADSGGQSSFVLNRTPKSSGRRHCQRACAINIEGLWIDKDDLHVVGQGSGIINVHECQWDKSSHPCGMWIIGSRARVGAHVRNWHRRSHVDSRAKCLWDGCTARMMLKDSLSRHVVTVHLGEGFHCRGCNQEFSRKDVYDEHVGNGGACMDASAVLVYGTERRMIDTHKVLQQGAPVRYAS